MSQQFAYLPFGLSVNSPLYLNGVDLAQSPGFSTTTSGMSQAQADARYLRITTGAVFPSATFTNLLVTNSASIAGLSSLASSATVAALQTQVTALSQTVSAMASLLSISTGPSLGTSSGSYTMNVASILTGALSAGSATLGGLSTVTFVTPTVGAYASTTIPDSVWGTQSGLYAFSVIGDTFQGGSHCGGIGMVRGGSFSAMLSYQQAYISQVTSSAQFAPLTIQNSRGWINTFNFNATKIC